MFLVPLDDRREWYRFHHLFRDLLRFRLRAEDPGAEAGLLGRAADWHLGRGEVSPAVEYLLRAQKWDEALDLIMARGSEVFERGEMATVIRWISDVPETARSGQTGRQPPPRHPQRQPRARPPAAEDILRTCRGRPRGVPRRAGLRPDLPGHPGPVAAQSRHRPSTWPSMPSTCSRASTTTRFPTVMNLSDPQSLETMALSLRRAGPLSGRPHGAGPGVAGPRDWHRPGRPTRSGGSAAWAR